MRSTVPFALVSAVLCFQIACNPFQAPEDKDVQDAAVSPDGKYYARSTGFGTDIYDIQSGNKIKALVGAAPANLKFSPDSKLLATAQFTELNLWDLGEGKALATWKGTNRYNFSVAFSGDGALLAAGDDNALRIWDTATQKELLKIGIPGELEGLAFAPDGKYVAAGTIEGKREDSRFHEIRIWEIPSGKVHAALRGPEYCYVNSLAFSPGGMLLASGISTSACRLWDLQAKKEVWIGKLPNVDGILSFTPDGKQLVVGGYTALAVLDTKDGKIAKQFRFPDLEATFGKRSEPIASLTTNSIPGQVVVATRKSVRSVDLTSGAQMMLFPKK
jgi:WD40 repeat protein